MFKSQLIETDKGGTMNFTDAEELFLSLVLGVLENVEEKDLFDISYSREFYKSISDQIEKGDINDDTVNFYITNICFGQNKKHIIDLIRAGCVYLYLANKANQNQNFDKSWSLLCQAFYLVGQASGSPIKDSALKNHEIAQKGGKARAKNIELVKNEALRLLKATQVQHWKSKNEAIQAIVKPLAEYIEANKISGITTSNLHDWLQKNLPKASDLKNGKF